MSPGPEGPMVDEIVTLGRPDRLAAIPDRSGADTPAFVAWVAGRVRRGLEFAGMRGFVRGMAG